LSECENRWKHGREANCSTVNVKVVIYEAFVERKLSSHGLRDVIVAATSALGWNALPRQPSEGIKVGLDTECGVAIKSFDDRFCALQ
jgi:hypothetical protein